MSRPFALYYGHGQLEWLAGHTAVAVQPGHYTPTDFAFLRERGVRVLTYLSLGEDFGERAPWHREERNAEWNTAYVNVAHPGWRARVLSQAESALSRGAAGWLLDTLDAVELDFSQRPAMLALMAELRKLDSQAYILANRGFALWPDFLPLIDGALIEGLSTTWVGGYRALTTQERDFTEGWVGALRPHLDVYGADYANSAALRAFALLRAAQLGVPTFVGTRELDAPREGGA